MSVYIIKETADEDDGLEGRLAHPSGALGAVTDAAYRSAQRDTRWPALAGAIAGLAVATGNRWVVALGGQKTPLNLYVLLLAPTGTGKEAARGIARSLTTETGSRSYDTIASDVALHETLTSRPNLLLNIDEFGRYLATMREDKGSHQNRVITMLMRLYGLARSELSAHNYANSKQNKPAVPKPFVNCLFTSTAVRYLEALEGADGEDGTLNRLLVIPGTMADLKDFEDIVHEDLPEPLVKMCENLKRGPLSGEGLDLVGRVMREGFEATEEDRKALIARSGLITCDEVTTARLKEIRSEADQRMQGDEGMPFMWVRAFEQTLRLAGIMSVADAAMVGPLPETVPLKHVQYARDLIFGAIKWAEGAMGDTVANLNEREKMQQAILDACVRLDQKMPADVRRPGDGWVPGRMLADNLKGRGRRRRDVTDEMEALFEAGWLEVVDWSPEAGPQQRSNKRRFYRRGGGPKGG
ncbi:hypothetical protein [Tateyamaria pelophila]|uniref:hypothetical protein n=1 Tax=Tateyamaria pelophila TaxID=328415 RepID=UPI001CBCB4B6|nr:hypothetical protein [Tateyamaria pelophila]